MNIALFGVLFILYTPGKNITAELPFTATVKDSGQITNLQDLS